MTSQAVVAVTATERGEQSRRRILDVAAGLFARHGYDGISLNEVIRATGLTKGGFYFHFASREALAKAVFTYKQEQWAGRVTAAAMGHAGGIDQLKAMARALVQLRHDDPSCGAVSKLAEALRDDPEFADRCDAQFETWIDFTASLVRKGQLEGEIRSDVDPTTAAQVAVAAFLGVEQLSEQLSGFADLGGRVEGLITVLELALRPTE